MIMHSLSRATMILSLTQQSLTTCWTRKRQENNDRKVPTHRWNPFFSITPVTSDLEASLRPFSSSFADLGYSRPVILINDDVRYSIAFERGRRVQWTRVFSGEPRILYLQSHIILYGYNVPIQHLGPCLYKIGLITINVDRRQKKEICLWHRLPCTVKLPRALDLSCRHNIHRVVLDILRPVPSQYVCCGAMQKVEHQYAQYSTRPEATWK